MICVKCGNEELTVQDELYVGSTAYYKAHCNKCGLTILFSTGAPTDKPAYFVHLPGRGEPKHTHDSEQSAIEEAQRLASKLKYPALVYRRIATISPVVKTEVKYG